MTTKNKTVKFISALLIISMIAPAVLLSKPKQAEALSSGAPGGFTANQTPQNIVGAAVCGAAGVGGAAGGAVDGAVTKLTGLGTSVPVSDSVSHGLLTPIAASTTTSTCIQTWTNVFEYVTKAIIKMAAKALLRKMTQDTINWINSDFHGAPLFLENPGSFFNDIAKSELKGMVDEFGYDDLAYPFGRQFALNAIDSYKRQLRDNARYTLSKAMNREQLRLFREDFDYGGWNGFLINTQYPQNNYLGFQMLMNDNLASRIEGTAQAPAKKYQDLLQQGMGFLSPQKCPSNPRYNDGLNEFQRPSFHYDVPPPVQIEVNSSTSEADMIRMQEENEKYLEEKTKAKEEWAIKNTCPGGLVNTTPGSVAANKLFNELDSPRMMTALDGALGNSVAAIFDALIQHFFDKGLNALSDFIKPQPSFNDHWSYNGNTLNNTNSNAVWSYNDNNLVSDPNALDIPQNVSVGIGETTSIEIFGGKKQYHIQTQNNQSKAIATARIDDPVPGSFLNSLTVIGVAHGETTIVVEDSTVPAQTVQIKITVTGDNLLKIPQNVSVTVGETTSAVISGGTGNYSVQIQSPESLAIATAVIDTSNPSSPKLTVRGIKSGTTKVVVQDSSIPAQTVTITITVACLDCLVASPASVFDLNLNNPNIVTLSGGDGNYSFIKEPKNTVAIAQFADTSLVVVGIGNGNTVASIKDSSGKSVKVKIIIGPDNLEANPASISNMNIGDSVIVTLSGGEEPYSLRREPDETIAKAVISGAKLTITGVGTNPKDNHTWVKIKDSSVPEKNVRVDISVSVGPDNSNVIITPSIVSVNIDEVINANISGGSGSYIVQAQDNPAVAKAKILSASLDRITITGKTPGTSTVTIQDSSWPFKTASITIVTIDNSFLNSPPVP